MSFAKQSCSGAGEPPGVRSRRYGERGRSGRGGLEMGAAASPHNRYWRIDVVELDGSRLVASDTAMIADARSRHNGMARLRYQWLSRLW